MSTFLSFAHLARRLFSSRPAQFGLNEEEVVHLKAAWQVVDSSPIPVAKIIFKDLFDKKPEYQKKFAEYDKGRPLLRQNEFIPHLRAVVTSLTKIIKRIEDEKEVDRVMDYIASSHHGKWVGLEEMEEMGKSIKSSLKVLNRNKGAISFEGAFDKFWKAFVDDYKIRLDKSSKGVTGETKK